MAKANSSKSAAQANAASQRKTMALLAAYQRVEVAPGVIWMRFSWGDWCQGSREAVLAAGLVEPEWLADGVKRNEHGKVIRTHRILAGGIAVETTTSAKGICVIRFYVSGKKAVFKNAERLAGAARDSYDGAQAIAWSACAWRPRPELACIRIDPVAIDKVLGMMLNARGKRT
jgi:hypothetical protein